MVMKEQIDALNELVELGQQIGDYDKPSSALPALLPCPFCGRKLVNVVVDPENGWAEHPRGTDCYFDGWEFDAFDAKRWNRRAT